MIQRIDVHAILQASIPGLYTDLVTRPTGRVVREHIERAIVDTTVALIDFTGVRCIDYSCADEIVAKLVLPAARPSRPVVLLGIRDEQREALDHVLSHHGVAVTGRLHESGEPVLLGAATPDLHQAFAALRERGATLDDFARLPIS